MVAPTPAPAPAPGDQGVLERCYHGTGCVGDRRHGGSGAEHNIAAWSQLTSPGSLHPCLHAFLSTSPLCPASAVSAVQPSAISSELCADTGSVRGSRRGGAACCAQCWTEAGGERTCYTAAHCAPHLALRPWYQQQRDTHTLTHTHWCPHHPATEPLVAAPPPPRPRQDVTRAGESLSRSSNRLQRPQQPQL